MEFLLVEVLEQAYNTERTEFLNIFLPKCFKGALVTVHLLWTAFFSRVS